MDLSVCQFGKYHLSFIVEEITDWIANSAYLDQTACAGWSWSKLVANANTIAASRQNVKVTGTFHYECYAQKPAACRTGGALY